jgi:plastocyanin
MTTKGNILTLILISISLVALHAQTNHNVQVSSNKFDPKEITISVGDTITWTNIGGNHNVNGTKATFPDNPLSFGNDVGEGWTYSFVFTEAGTYDYQCNPHASFGMVGTVTVNGQTTSLDNQISNQAEFKLYPNPVDEELSIEPINFTENTYANVQVLDITGKTVINSTVYFSHSPIVIQTTHLQSGTYVLQIESDSEISISKFLKK